MRNAVINELERLAKVHDISVFTADLGYSVFENFAKKYPQKFYNVGICEQFMTSCAAGLAICGEIVVTYSIGNFNTLRCLEQIRNDICYHNAHVIIISVGGGFSYGSLGMSHHATEDIAIMSVLPNMKVFAPGDPEEAVEAIRFAVNHDGPSYIRLARRGEPVLYNKSENFNILKLNAIVENNCRVAIFASGPILSEAIKCNLLLKEKGIISSVYSVPTIKPIDSDGIDKLAKKYDIFITIEEHQRFGGLGTIINEELDNIKGQKPKIVKFGLNNEFTSIVGSETFLQKFYHIDSQSVADFIEHKLFINL